MISVAVNTMRDAPELGTIIHVLKTMVVKNVKNFKLPVLSHLIINMILMTFLETTLHTEQLRLTKYYLAMSDAYLKSYLQSAIFSFPFLFSILFSRIFI